MPARSRFRAAAVAALALLAGCASRPEPACGRILDDRGEPLAGAEVRADPGGAARTDDQGRFCIALGSAAARIAARAPGACVSPPVAARAGGWVDVRLARQLAVASLYQVGFGADVALHAELRCPLPGRASFRWTQIDGPPLALGAGASSGSTLRFRTLPLAARTVRPDVLALSPAQAGWYRFRVAASGGGVQLETEAEVRAAGVQGGLLSVPVDADVYVDAGRDNPAGGWALEAKPNGSQAVLRPVPTADGSGGVVRLRPDRTGLYEVRETAGGTRLIFEAGPWDAVPRDCHRPECHPAEQALWKETRHARALDARLEQRGDERFGGRCLGCHTVGWDPGARSAGFDDVASDTRVRVRDGWPGGAAALPRDLRRLANVWCIDCHGPGRLPQHGKRPMVVRAGVCAQCHDAPPRYRTGEEWRGSRMARPLADAARAETRCAGCHTAQGAVARLRGRFVTGVPAELAEPVTCAVCHVAHTAGEKLLRQTGTVATLGGVLFEAGRGAVCFGCHQAGGKPDAAAEAARRLPEAPQAEVLFGLGAFGGPGRPGPLSRNLCTDCHMARCVDCHDDPDRHRGGHTFRAMPVTAAAPQDCDGDGVRAPLGEEIDACLREVQAAVTAALRALPGCEQAVLGRAEDRLVPLGPGGERLPECESAWNAPEQTALYRAAYDHALIARDGSRGAHNPEYAILVLRRTLEALRR